MATEGIMALPQGTGMPGEEPQNQPLAVTSADSYDAAQTALGMVNPGDQEAAKQAVQEAIGDLQLTPDQLSILIQIFEYVSQNPGEYKNLVQQMIEAGAVEPGDFPEEYDAEFIGMVLVVLNEMQMMQGQGAQEPVDLSPVIEGLQPMGMAQGGLADVASYLASKGRGGDSILAHITPEEAAMLKRRGGAGTINPMTGLPEFKGGPVGKIVGAVKGVVKSVVNVTKKALKSPVGRILGTIALATVLGPAGVGLSLGSTAATSAAINFGLASAGTTLLGGGSVKEALISGAMGYFGGGGTAFGVNPMSAIGQYLPGAAGSALNTGLASGVLGAGIGKLSGMSTQDALKMGLTSGATAAAMTGLRGTGLDMSPEQRAARDAQFRQSLTAAGGGAQGSVAPGGVGTAADLLAAPGGSVPADYQADFYRSIGIDPASVSGPSASPMTNAQIEQGILGLPGGPAAPTAPATPAGYQDEFYRSIGIDPASVSGPSGTSPTNVQIERDMLGMRGFGDTASQLVRDPMSVAKGVYNEYLSPSRPGLPADASFFRKYGPLTLAGTGIMAAAGGMKGSPSNPNPAFNRAYTGLDYMRDNPQMFQGGLDFSYQRPTTPPNPVVTTDFSRTIPLGAPGQVAPMGVTMSPAGVAQPYNVAGMYGIPLIYGQGAQPMRFAKGGELSMTEFPRKTGPINGPGTGTSDSIPAMLSDGEFVFTAKAVRNAGNGSRRKGAARMYKLMKKLEGGPVKG
jgi:hypothetical protein